MSCFRHARLVPASTSSFPESRRGWPGRAGHDEDRFAVIEHTNVSGTLNALVLNEEQSMLRDSARGLISDKAPVSHLRQLRDARDATGFP